MTSPQIIDRLRYELELKEYFDSIGYDNVETVFIHSKKWLDLKIREKKLQNG